MSLTGQLPRTDLLRSLRVCKKWHRVGEAITYRELSFPLALDCATCVELVITRDTASLQRLRVIRALLESRLAARVRLLSITDADTFCLCPESRALHNSVRGKTFARFLLRHTDGPLVQSHSRSNNAV